MHENLSGEWIFDPEHSWIGMTVRYAKWTKVPARFAQVDAVLSFTEDHGEITATAQSQSFDSGHPIRDEHVRGPDFLHAEEYPAVTFDGTLNNDIMHGDLTIRGITRHVDFTIHRLGHIVDANGIHRLGAEASATIQRSDFAMRWNSPLRDGGFILSNDVHLQLHVSFLHADGGQVGERVPFITHRATTSTLDDSVIQ